MKRIFITLLALMAMVGASAMTESRVRTETLFLTDKMSYELRLSSSQYNDVYEINYDFMSAVSNIMDDVVYGESWALNDYYEALDIRNDDLRWVLSASQYRRFLGAEYFCRPIYQTNAGWGLRIYITYTNPSVYYCRWPSAYTTYFGGHYRGGFDDTSYYRYRYSRVSHYNRPFRMNGDGYRYNTYVNRDFKRSGDNRYYNNRNSNPGFHIGNDTNYYNNNNNVNNRGNVNNNININNNNINNNGNNTNRNYNRNNGVGHDRNTDVNSPRGKNVDINTNINNNNGNNINRNYNRNNGVGYDRNTDVNSPRGKNVDVNANINNTNGNNTNRNYNRNNGVGYDRNTDVNSPRGKNVDVINTNINNNNVNSTNRNYNRNNGVVYDKNADVNSSRGKNADVNNNSSRRNYDRPVKVPNSVDRPVPVSSPNKVVTKPATPTKDTGKHSRR